MSALSEMVVKCSGEQLPELLPGIFACDGQKSFDVWRELIGKENLREKRVNIYYGKHADNISEDKVICSDRETQHALYCPVAFIFNVEKMKLDNIYPFNPEIFNPKDARIKMDDYELGKSVENIQKYILWVYGSNDNYLKGKVDSIKTATSRTMVNLIAEQNVSFDTRLSTVTMLVEKINLLQEYLECIIIPEKLKVYEEFKIIESSTNLKIRTYETITVEYPSRYNWSVGKLCEEYIKEREGI